MFSVIIVRVSLGISTDGPLPPDDTTSYHTGRHVESDSHTRPSSRLSRFSRMSPTSSPSRLWPVQPHRPINPSQGRGHKHKSGLSFWNPHHGQGQTHYNLRSQAEHPSSYFRASEDMEIDTELEFEIDEARYRQPKALPVALMLPSSGHDLGH